MFTSGATEANALAIHALGDGRRVIVGATEHDAVRAAAPDAIVLPVDRRGVADLDALAALLNDVLAQNLRPALVCLMLANNETGTLQPITEAAALCRQYGARLHVDAVQAAGRIPVDLATLCADSLAISSHKLGGPPGAGALLLAPDVSTIAPLIAGGGQERGRRGGTPPLPAIAGFAAAAACDPPMLAALRDAIERIATGRRRSGLRGWRRAAAGQYHLSRPARAAGGCAGYRARSRRDRGERRRRVQLRQGGVQPCAGGDGARRVGRGGDPRVAAVERDGRQRCRLRHRLPAHGGTAACGPGTARSLTPHFPP